MKKYLAFAVLGLMLVLVQPSFAQCGCPVSMDPCCPVCPACPVCPDPCAPVCPACPVIDPCACAPVCPAAPICPTCAPVCPACPVCPTCPPRLTFKPVYEPVAPVIQTVVEPVMSYQYRQIATCPNVCDPCAPCGITGAAAPMYMYGYGAIPSTVVYEEADGFWEGFFEF